MKIVLFGATGNTGLQLAAQAVQRGHEVTALVRDPTKLSSLASSDKLKIVKCDILNPDEIAPHMAGHDAVLSGLGVHGIKIFKITFYQDSIKSIVAAMRKSNIKRLLCVTSFYSQPNPDYPVSYTVFIRPMLGRHFDSMCEMENYLIQECQDIDYTIVRPPRLLDEPLADAEVKINENACYFPDYSTKNMIPRANVAKYMLDAMEKNLNIKQAVAVDLPK